MPTIKTIARQLGLLPEDLLATAQALNLPAESIDSPVDAAIDFTLRKAISAGAPITVRQESLPFPVARRPVRPRRESDLSDLAKLVLAARDGDPYRVANRYRPNDFADAEWIAEQWARYWFTPAEVKEWLTLHPRISPSTAQSLKQAGITPQEATKDIRYGRNVAVAVSCGDLTAEQAAAELRTRRTA